MIQFLLKVFGRIFLCRNLFVGYRHAYNLRHKKTVLYATSLRETLQSLSHSIWEKRIALSVFLVFIFNMNTLFSAEIKLGIYSENQKAKTNIERKILNYKDITLIEREELKTLLKEIRLSKEGVLDEKAELGFSEVDYFVFIDKEGSFRLVDKKTAKILANYENTSELNLENFILVLENKKLVKKILEFEKEKNPDFEVLISNFEGVENDNQVKTGKEIRFQFSIFSQKDFAYLKILSINESGEVTLLFPNKYEKNSEVKTNTTLFFPKKNQTEYKLITSQPLGKEKIIFLVSDVESFYEEINYDPKDFFLTLSKNKKGFQFIDSEQKKVTVESKEIRIYK